MLATVLPNEGAGFWPLVSMGAILGGTMRSPFTGIVFALELTHDVNILLPLLVDSIIAHGFTVLTLRRSILTEKVARRGYHLSREYATDPLEILFVREVMRTNIVVLPAHIPLGELGQSMWSDHGIRQRLYPVVGADGCLMGVVTRNDVEKFLREHPMKGGGPPLTELVRPNPVKAYVDEPLRAVVYRMAETGVTRLPVVETLDPNKVVGIVSLNDLLRARMRGLEEERRRERLLTMRQFFPLVPMGPHTG